MKLAVVLVLAAIGGSFSISGEIGQRTLSSKDRIRAGRAVEHASSSHQFGATNALEVHKDVNQTEDQLRFSRHEGSPRASDGTVAATTTATQSPLTALIFNTYENQF